MDEIGGDPGAHGLIRWLDMGDRFLAHAGAKIPLLQRLQSHTALSARSLLLGVAGLLLLLLLPPLVYCLLNRPPFLRQNYRGQMIPQSAGLIVLFWSAAMLALAGRLLPAQRPELTLWLVAVGAFGILGLLDDVFGDRKIKGLRGHFGAALRERRITTGFLKAIGGILAALWLGHRLEPYSAAGILLCAALIALSANAVNLLDLRPGRAGGAFLFIAVLMLLFGLRAGSSGVFPLLFLVVPTLPVWAKDARARVMLGDTGSNLLGACLGLGLCAFSITVRLIALALLIALHVLAERVSLTTLIERNAFLRRLDALTGIRESV